MNKRLWCALLACLLLLLPLQGAQPTQLSAGAQLSLQSLPDAAPAPAASARHRPFAAAPVGALSLGDAACLACARMAICARPALRGSSILALSSGHPRLAPPSQQRS